MTEYSEERQELIDRLVRRGYISRQAVASAMRKVPREEFLPESLKRDAYVDSPLPIGSGQTISAPHMVAIMIEALELEPGLKVLEVGAGSGYHAAVTAELISPGGRVLTVERIGELAEFARSNLARTGYDQVVEVIHGDGSKGLPEKAPFDRIFVACGAPSVPKPLTEQLAEDGVMLAPIGGRMYQDLVRVRRIGQGFVRENLGGCVFVPLIGEFGY